jgi:hypothetical protein
VYGRKGEELVRKGGIRAANETAAGHKGSEKRGINGRDRRTGGEAIRDLVSTRGTEGVSGRIILIHHLGPNKLSPMVRVMEKDGEPR